MNSIWSETVNLKTFHSLDQNMTVDTAVIGGGLAGILTAYKLKEHGVESIILEAGEILHRSTARYTIKSRNITDTSRRLSMQRQTKTQLRNTSKS